MKTLLDIVHRQAVPEPWQEGDNIPWNDPDFSKRMLREHLSQHHNKASRCFEIIDRHVAWVHQTVLSQAYTEEQYRSVLEVWGFDDVSFYPSLLGVSDPVHEDLFAIVARKHKMIVD